MKDFHHLTYRPLSDQQTSYWKVVLTTGKMRSERESVLDLRQGGYRKLDWALDIVTTGDIKKIKELHLVCPDGQVAIIDNIDPGTVFQFKYQAHDFFGASGSILEAQGIGRITNKEEGTCECAIWDRFKGLLPYYSNVYDFGMWREGLLPIKDLSHAVLGLRI